MRAGRGIEDLPNSSEVRVGMMTAGGLTFGPFRYDAASGLLYREKGGLVPLGGRGQRLLALLLERRGAVVSKASLIDAAWPDEAIEDSNLSVQIAQLRKLIGADRILTVERVGYRFAPDPAEIHPGQMRPVLAIPPFTPLDHPAREAHTELLALFAGFNAFRVIAADAEHARYALRGNVRRTANGSRVSVHLVESATNEVLWGRSADGNRAGIAPLLAQIASTVEAEIVRAETARIDREAPDHESPYHLYLRGQALGMTGRSDANLEATRLLGAAVTAEPDNPAFLAAAVDALAGQRIPLGWAPIGDDDRALALSYGLRGLNLGTADAGSRSLFGIAVFRGGDPDFGYWIARDAAERNPNSALALVGAGNVTRNWGNTDEARDYFHRAIALNPTGPMLRFACGGLAAIESDAGRFEEALVWGQRAFAANQNHAAAYWHMTSANAKLGRLDVARKYLKRLQTLHPTTTLKQIEAGQPTRTGHLRNTLDGLAQAGLQ